MESFIDNELNGYFNLLCEIIRQPGCFRELQVDLTGIEDIINKKIPETLGKNAPEDFYSLYTDFKSEYDKFRNFILYDKLIGKNIIALGGGFSSGKSSFLNVLLGDLGILPEDTKPSTSVPTYIVSGEQHELMGNNIFDTTVHFQLSNIKDIAYGFGRIKNEDEEKVTDEVALGHILQNIFFSTPLNKYKNIAFLDTPGYSKPDSEQYSIKTDAQIARGQLNSSNYILWFVQADSGTITEEDIKFIRSLREDIPKLIIVNKADKKNLSDLQKIIAKIRSNLDLKGIQYEGVYAFSCRKEQIGDERLRSFICKDEENILKQIEAWNNEIYESNFARNFKILFMRCKDYYDQEIDNERRRMTRLNTSITRLMAEDIDMDILEPLQRLVKEARRTVDELKAVSQKLRELQNEFFTEIKRISDIVGIAMPEPSEIDLLQDKVLDPLNLLEEYKTEKGIVSDKSVLETMQEIIEELNPVINRRAGGSEYREEVLDVIKRTIIGELAGDTEIKTSYKTREVENGISEEIQEVEEYSNNDYSMKMYVNGECWRLL